MKLILNILYEMGISRMFENVFYIIRTDLSHLFQLALVDTHQVISTSATLDGILDNMLSICKKYKDPITLYRTMNNCSYVYSDSTIGFRKNYLLMEHPFSDQIESKLATLYTDKVKTPENTQNVSTSLKKTAELKVTKEKVVPTIKRMPKVVEEEDSSPSKVVLKKKKLIKPIIRKSV